MDESSTEPATRVGHTSSSLLDDELSSNLHHLLLDLEAETGCSCSSILVGPATRGLQTHGSPHLPARFEKAIQALAATVGAGAAGDCHAAGTSPASIDIFGSPLCAGMHDLAEAEGMRFCGSAPVWDGNGELAGLIAAFANPSGRPVLPDLQPLTRAAQLVAIAIDRHRGAQLQRIREESLSDKTRVLEATFERMEQGLMVVSPERVVELCNRKAIELLDLPRDLMASRPHFGEVLEYQWSKEEFSHTPEHLREFVRAGGILDMPQCYQRVRPSGQVIEVHSVPIEGGGVLRTYSDITDRVSDEKALHQSEERLQRALDASRLALWDLDMTTGEVYLSDAWAEMLGLARNETRTTFAALTASVPDEDQSRIAEAMGAAFRDLDKAYSLEHQVRRPDGELLWVHSQGRAVEISTDGRVLRAVGTNRDITERKRAEAAQRSLEGQLREAQRLEAVGTLAGGIAHDFNNIIAAILGNAALAHGKLGANHPAQLFLNQIVTAGKRARSVVKQILTFSRQQQEELSTISLRPVLEETVSMLRSMVSGSVHVHAILPHQRLAVNGNPTQLQQVFMNLGTNAWQALREGVGNITLGLEECSIAPATTPGPGATVLPCGTYAHIWVRDDGHGMSEDTRQRIFEPFFTTKAVGKGTGLGLAVALGVIQAHAGFIEVKSAIGKGSSFDLYLPLVDLLSAPMPLELGPDMFVRGQGEHVLYVDDDEVMALMVDGLLKRLGYRSTYTLDAREALVIANRDSEAVDLVVTDYNMPAYSGIDLALALSRSKPGLPVAISSGYISDDLKARAAEIGVFAVMQKERTLEELGELVSAALKSGR